MTEMYRALFKYESEMKIGWNNWLETCYFTQITLRVEKGDILGWTPSYMQHSLICKTMPYKNALHISGLHCNSNISDNITLIITGIISIYTVYPHWNHFTRTGLDKWLNRNRGSEIVLTYDPRKSTPHPPVGQGAVI